MKDAIAEIILEPSLSSFSFLGKGLGLSVGAGYTARHGLLNVLPFSIRVGVPRESTTNLA